MDGINGVQKRIRKKRDFVSLSFVALIRDQSLLRRKGRTVSKKNTSNWLQPTTLLG
jgi:hypothetical protein